MNPSNLTTEFISELVNETNSDTVLFMLRQISEKAEHENKVKELTTLIEVIQKATKYNTVGILTEERDALNKQVGELMAELNSTKERNAVLTKETIRLQDNRETIRAELEKSLAEFVKTAESIRERTDEIGDSMSTLLGESSEIIGILTEVPDKADKKTKPETALA